MRKKTPGWGKKGWAIALPFVFLATVLIAGCGENSPAVTDPYGPLADSQNQIFWIILIIATVVFIGVEAALIYSAFRYRERPDSPTPRQTHGNVKIELFMTMVPVVILAVVLFVTIQGIWTASSASPLIEDDKNNGNVVEVEAIGHQWWWEFYYPKYKFTTADTLVVPANKTVLVKLFSNNVIHSFWIPNLTGKVDVVPGHDNERWFKADTKAIGKTFLGICAEYCGTQHANMRFDVSVTNDGDFNKWVSVQQSLAVQPEKGSLAEKGSTIFKNQCVICHGIVGNDIKSWDDVGAPSAVCNNPNDNIAPEAMNPSCRVGPNLTHFGSRHFIAGGVLEWNAESCNPTASDLYEKCNLAKWLKDPQAVKPGNAMAVSLSDADIRALVAYLESLK